MKAKFLKVIAILALLSLVFTACAPKAPGGPGESVTPEGTLQGEPGGQPQPIDTLRVGIAAMINQFDPGYSIGIQSIKIFYNIFDTLLTRDKNGNVAGQLAESWDWADDKTLNVKLRSGITFHNGEPCTAEDVKFTFDRIMSGFGDGTVAALYETLESVDIIDDLTVQFKTKVVDAAFLDRLSSVWGASIVPKDYLEEIGDEAFQTAPIGTGPYMMTSFSPEKMVLTRYDGFWGEAPNARVIEFILFPEASARITALLTGEVDIVNDITSDLVDSIEGQKGVKVVGTPVDNIHIYVFNTENGPMASQKFRQALTIAINRQQLVDSLWGKYAYVPNGHQFPSYGDMYIDEYPGIQYDLERAKALVKESGYDGTTIEIQMRPGYYMNGDQAGEAIVDMWKQIGVNAKVVYVEKMTWDFPHVRSWSSASRFDDPLGALWLLFGTGTNPAKYTWKDMPQDWIQTGQKLITTADKTERRALASDLVRMFDEYCPGTYLYAVEDLYGIRDGLDWDMHYAKNQIMSFRAEDFKPAA